MTMKRHKGKTSPGVSSSLAPKTAYLSVRGGQGIPARNHLESFQCVYFRIQIASHPSIQGYGQSWRIPGSPVLMRVLACRAAVAGHPFPEKVLSRSRGARSKRALGDGSQRASALV